MLTSSCHFVKREKKLPRSAHLYSHFFCIKQRNIEKTEVNKEDLNIFYSFQKLFKICPSFLGQNQKNYLLSFLIASILLGILNIALLLGLSDFSSLWPDLTLNVFFSAYYFKTTRIFWKIFQHTLGCFETFWNIFSRLSNTLLGHSKTFLRTF